MKNSMKKGLAFVLATVMAFGAPLTSFAAAEGAGQIFYFDVTTVDVPTDLLFAMNPGKLDVYVNGTQTQDQILSNEVAIVNKSNNGRFIALTLDVAAPEGVEIVTKGAVEAEVATKSTIKAMNVRLLPANAGTSGAEIQVLSGASATATDITSGTSVEALANAKAKGYPNNEAGYVDLDSGANTVVFVMSKAAYTVVDSGAVMGTTTFNDVNSLYDLDNTVNAESVVAFKFGGSMNEYATWSGVGTEKVSISVTYDTTVKWFGETVSKETGTSMLTSSAALEVIGRSTGESGESGGSGSSAATTLTGSYDSANTTYKINLAEAVGAASDITNFKVDGVAAEFTLNQNKNLVKVARSAASAAHGGSLADVANLTFTFTINGTNYTCTIAKNG